MLVLSRFVLQLRHFLGDICRRQKTGFHSVHDVFDVVTGYNSPRPSTLCHVKKNETQHGDFYNVFSYFGNFGLYCCRLLQTRIQKKKSMWVPPVIQKVWCLLQL